MAAKKAATKTNKPAKGAGGAVSATLKPVSPTPGDAAMAKPTPGRQPTAEQIAAWKALPAEQKLALREREAARVFGIGVEHHQKGEYAEAVEAYGKSLLLNPKIPDTYNNMGVALRQVGKLEASIACYRRSLVLRPNNAGAYSNMGNALRELGRLQLAVAAHQQAVRLDPKGAEYFYNMGLALRDLGQTDQALAAFETTLTMVPEHVDCRWDRALTLLTKGEFVEGFEQYEWRWRLERSPPRGFSQPMWDGSELKGKTLLIHQEQGFGDMIHFARFVPMVKERVGTVVLETQPELARLFSTVPGVDKVVNRGAPLPKFDYYIPMMSLARVLGTTAETIPAEVPYLTAPEMHAVQLPASMERQRQIGISWAGKPTHQNDKNRSCDFTQFVELLGIPGVIVYSLQKGPRETDIKETGCESLVFNLGPRLNDFADTASVIQQLDMVITVDTAIAHLAAALGKPAWVVIPFAADWRWLTDEKGSPWYPTVRLFRQKRPGAWDQVFADVRKALREEIGIKAPTPVQL